MKQELVTKDVLAFNISHVIMSVQFYTHNQCTFVANYIIFNEILTSARKALCILFTWKTSVLDVYAFILLICQRRLFLWNDLLWPLMVCSAMGIFTALFCFPALQYVYVYVCVCVLTYFSPLPISWTYDRGIQDCLKGTVHHKINPLPFTFMSFQAA